MNDLLTKATAPKIIYHGVEIKYSDELDRYWIGPTRKLYITTEQAMEDIDNMFCDRKKNNDEHEEITVCIPKILYRGVEIKYSEPLNRYWIKHTKKLYSTVKQAMEDIDKLRKEERKES